MLWSLRGKRNLRKIPHVSPSKEKKKLEEKTRELLKGKEKNPSTTTTGKEKSNK